MKSTATLLCLLFLSVFLLPAQDDLPLREIPEAPSDYRSGNVLARMIEGLGYRYYWATEGLRQEDLDYRPTPESRSANETLNHIYGLSSTILNGAKNEPNVRPAAVDPSTLSFEEKRRMTLKNLAEAAELMRGKNKKGVAKLMLVFQRGERKSEYPYWNMINGPIADAIWHTGQIVSFRRSSGNPINPKVNVFVGKTRE